MRRNPCSSRLVYHVLDDRAEGLRGEGNRTTEAMMGLRAPERHTGEQEAVEPFRYLPRYDLALEPVD